MGQGVKASRSPEIRMQCKEGATCLSSQRMNAAWSEERNPLLPLYMAPPFGIADHEVGKLFRWFAFAEGDNTSMQRLDGFPLTVHAHLPLPSVSSEGTS
jgi:hypothetical protein